MHLDNTKDTASTVVVIGKVVPWHRPQNKWGGHGRIKPQADRDAQRLIAAFYKAQGGKNYGSTPVAIAIHIHRSAPKSAREGEHDIHTPDIDNISKQVLDALEGVAYVNDKQVVELKAYKHPRFWGDEFMEVTVIPLPQEEKTKTTKRDRS